MLDRKRFVRTFVQWFVRNLLFSKWMNEWMNDWYRRRVDILENWRRLDQSKKEVRDLHVQIEKNHYHPNDCHDLCPSFSRWFPLILWYSHRDLRHPIAIKRKISFFFIDDIYVHLLWVHCSSVIEKFLHGLYAFHLWVSNNWRQLKVEK